MRDPHDPSRIARLVDDHVDRAFTQASFKLRKELNLLAKRLLDALPRPANQEVDVPAEPMVVRPGTEQPNFHIIAEHVGGDALDFAHWLAGQADTDPRLSWRPAWGPLLHETHPESKFSGHPPTISALRSTDQFWCPGGAMTITLGEAPATSGRCRMRAGVRVHLTTGPSTYEPKPMALLRPDC